MQIDDWEYQRLVRIERAARALFRRIPLHEMLEWEDGQGRSLAAPVKRLTGALDVKPRRVEGVLRSAPDVDPTCSSALYDVARGEVIAGDREE